MRGVNFGGWFSQIDCIQEKDPGRFSSVAEHVATFLGATDFDRIALWGFDHVRLPIDYFNLFAPADLAPNEPMLRSLDRAVQGITKDSASTGSPATRMSILTMGESQEPAR